MKPIKTAFGRKSRHTMDNKKPRLAELLGVEVGEVFGFEYRGALKPNEYYINDCGVICYAQSKNPVSVMVVYDLIERSDTITHKPRFTDEEMTVLRWIYKTGFKRVERREDGYFYYIFKDGVLESTQFPSIRPGESVDLEAMFGKEGGDA